MSVNWTDSILYLCPWIQNGKSKAASLERVEINSGAVKWSQSDHTYLLFYDDIKQLKGISSNSSDSDQV